MYRNPALGASLQGDGGSFTLSTSPAAIPTPSSLILALTALGGLFPFTTRLRRRTE